jgi:hypothetical protein
LKDCNITTNGSQNYHAIIIFEDGKAFQKARSSFRWIDQKQIGVNLDKEDVPVLYLKKSNKPFCYILNLLNIVKFSMKHIRRNIVAFAVGIERRHLFYAILILFLSRGRIYAYSREGKLNLVLLRNLFDIALPWRLLKFFGNVRSYIMTILFRLIVGSWVKTAERQREK